MQGHEGLGLVVKVGKNVFSKVEVGNFVATRGEPAYADYYPVKDGEFVIVPEANPRYIIEPVACGINVVLGDLGEIQGRSYATDNPKLLIVGSGFLAYVAYKTLKNVNVEMVIDVVGSSNQDIWQAEGVQLLNRPNKGYEVIINLKEEHKWFEDSDIINNNGCLIDAVGRSISKRESENLLWKAVTTNRPSPRKSGFLECMELGVEWIRDGKLNVDSFWTKGYNRNIQWQQAFEDGNNRPKNYSRGYITWL
jgi:threonine dehydrogenase-like Zn-dependent dehydrogenase